MYLLPGISNVVFSYVNGFDTMASLLGLLYPILLIVVGWGLTKLKYWAWVCVIALIIYGVFRAVYDLIIYGYWQDILGVAISIAVLMYFLAAKTRSQFTWH